VFTTITVSILLATTWNSSSWFEFAISFGLLLFWIREMLKAFRV
jgi:hypothetical protein